MPLASESIRHTRGQDPLAWAGTVNFLFPDGHCLFYLVKDYPAGRKGRLPMFRLNFDDDGDITHLKPADTMQETNLIGSPILLDSIYD